MSEQMKTVRFWESLYVNDRWQWMGICLTAEVPVYEWGYSTPTDEGWYSESRVFELVEDGVTFAVSRSETDCDGRMDHDAEYFCPFAGLEADAENEDCVPRPAWERVSSAQRDHAAEAAGY